MFCRLQANTVSGLMFNTGQESHSLPVIMKRLQNITIKRSRGTFNKMSIINKMRALKASASKKQFDVAKLEGSATPESEGETLDTVFDTYLASHANNAMKIMPKGVVFCFL